MKAIVLLVLLTVACCASDAQTAEPFAFPIPGFDSAHSATDVSFLNEDQAGESGRAKIVDGHFVDGKGERLRLLGVNFSFGANFPEHEDAEKVAAHLAKLGINAVRHHHMDSRDIWRSLPDGKREVDPEKLEKLAFLITQLGKHGIYSNINLHVSRSVIASEGFPDAQELPRYNKFVLYLDDRLQKLLRDYARTVLTYRNPHTGRRLADEPSLVTVEITNENRFAVSGHEQVFSLPQRYQDEFQKRWNVFLKQQYGSTATLREAWDVQSEPLGADTIDLSDFGKKTAGWSLNVRGGNKAQLRTGQQGPNGATPAVQVAIDQVDGETHYLEFSRTGLTLQEGKLYTVSFWLRSAKPREVYFDISTNGDPWRPVGVGERIRATPEWQQVVKPFRATRSLDGRARWIFKLGDEEGDVFIAAPRLQQGANAGLFDDQCSLEQGTIPIPRSLTHEAMIGDMRSFMEETERVFFERHVQFLKDELGVRVPVTGSQARWQSLSAFKPLDFIDAHAYWQHPRFPNTSWSSTDWTIGNTPMLWSPGSNSLIRLAWYRVWGLPFTVSEYNHPAPHDYQIECVPLLCALAALQDWDGVYVYSYQHGSGSWDTNHIQQFFDINGNPAKLALLPLGAMIFRRADLQRANQQVTVTSDHTPAVGVALEHRVGAQLDSEPAIAKLSQADGTRYVSDTGQLRWENSDKQQARVTLDTPRTKLVLGFVAPGNMALDGLDLKIGPASRGFGLLALTSLDGEALKSSRHMLLTSIANASNHGMQWNDERTSISNKWGTGPAVVEMVPAAITIERSAQRDDHHWIAYPLDPTGERRKGKAIAVNRQSLQFEINPDDKTVWYELVEEADPTLR